MRPLSPLRPLLPDEEPEESEPPPAFSKYWVMVYGRRELPKRLPRSLIPDGLAARPTLLLACPCTVDGAVSPKRDPKPFSTSESPDDPGNRSDKSNPSSPGLDEGVEEGDELVEPPKRSARSPSPPRPPSRRGSFLKAEEDPGNQSERSNPPGPPGAVDEGVGLEDGESDEPPKRSPRSGPLPAPSLEKPPEPGASRSPRLNWRDLMVGVGAPREPAARARMSADFMVSLG